MRSLSLDGLLAGDDQQVQQVQRIVAQDGGVEEAELILNGPVARDDEIRDLVPTPTSAPT